MVSETSRLAARSARIGSSPRAHPAPTRCMKPPKTPSRIPGSAGRGACRARLFPLGAPLRAADLAHPGDMPQKPPDQPGPAILQPVGQQPLGRLRVPGAEGLDGVPDPRCVGVESVEVDGVPAFPGNPQHQIERDAPMPPGGGRNPALQGTGGHLGTPEPALHGRRVDPDQFRHVARGERLRILARETGQIRLRRLK